MQTLKDFYNFYKGIPEEKWCTGKFENEKGQCCALGHIGQNDEKDSKEFSNLLCLTGRNENFISINDGDNKKYPQSTPKQRVLAFLIDKIQEKEDSTFKG